MSPARPTSTTAKWRCADSPAASPPDPQRVDGLRRHGPNALSYTSPPPPAAPGFWTALEFSARESISLLQARSMPAISTTGAGTVLDIALRLAGPVLLAFTVLALRARTLTLFDGRYSRAVYRRRHDAQPHGVLRSFTLDGCATAKSSMPNSGSSPRCGGRSASTASSRRAARSTNSSTSAYLTATPTDARCHRSCSTDRAPHRHRP